ncbi:MAG: hypothetical protein HC850_18385 [Rhodomicrobium sp.]|nr:hypothetical protein [Rhodomicrobium sp.]
MVNVLYDVPLGGRFEVSVGVGAGGNLIVLTPGRFDFGAFGLEADDYVFAAQAIAQAAYRLTDRWQLYLDYHFMWNDDPEFQDPTNPNEIWVMEKIDHAAMLGIRFDLQGVAAPPPPSPPPSRTVSTATRRSFAIASAGAESRSSFSPIRLSRSKCMTTCSTSTAPASHHCRGGAGDGVQRRQGRQSVPLRGRE